jgi:hypothetical protein|tara:strand:- start:530 stop:850 length:321 start_codon:yes stop_codon:yes gene_type:complete
MKANNVITFPEGNIVRKIPRPEDELGNEFAINKKRYLDTLTEHYSSNLLTKLGLHGFNINDEDFIRNYAYTVECLRSTLYQSIGINHPLKKHVDKCIDEIESFDKK